MHYSIDCYVAKALLPVKYQITAHRPFMHGMQLKQGLLLYCLQVLNRLTKIVMVAEKNFSWGSTTQQNHLSYQHAATLVFCSYVTRTEQVLGSSCLSRMSSPKHNCYLSYNRYARSGCHSWLSFITIVIQAHIACSKLYERGYHVKLQRQEYTERRTTENKLDESREGIVGRA